MKNKQVKAAEKASRKKIKQEIGVTVLNELQKIAGNFKADSKKTDKYLKKAADKLAKKLFKAAKADNAPTSAKPKIEASEAVKTTVDTQPKADAKPVAVATEPVKAQPAEKAKRGPKAKPAAEPLK